MDKTVEIYLDGLPVADTDLDGIAGSKITYDMNSDDGLLSVAYSNTLSFSGAAYSHIISTLIDSPTANSNSVEMRIFATCCKASDGSPLLLFSGLISRRDVSFCEFGNEQCSVAVTALDNSVTADKIRCVRDTIIHARVGPSGITSNGEDTARVRRFFAYYEETRPYSSAYFTFFIGLYLVVLATTTFLIIDIITRILNFISFGAIPVISFSDNRAALLALFFKKRYRTAPFINSYLQNACTLCQLSLRSPLFDVGGTFYNLTRLDAPILESGRDGRAETAVWRDFNRPNITFAQFFASFRELNIGYAVTDTELIFDRLDRLQNTVWIDFAARQNDIISLCYQPNDTVQPAGEVFKFADDATDKVGNESNRLWSGNVVDYNTPTNPILSGIKQTTVQYGTARFIDDGGSSAIKDISETVLYSVVGLGTNIVEKDAMIMSSGTCLVPKLLLWDGTSPFSNAKVKRYPNGGAYAYNVPVWLNQNASTTFNQPTFFSETLAQTDPRNSLSKSLNYTLVFNYSCDDLRSIGYGKTIRISRNNTMVTGSIETIEIDLELGEITINGKI